MLIETTSKAPAGWDDYAAGHALGTAYHRAAAVEIGRRAFGLRTWFLTARRTDGAIGGILPVIEQSSLLFGRFLVSVPFFTYGGVLADEDAAAVALAERAAELARERRADHVELRQAAPIEGLSLPARLEKVSMVLPLPATEEALGKQLGSKLRSQIRRAERESPDVVWGGSELIPEFYRVFAVTMHSLGTPVYPRRFFATACEAFGELARVLVIRMNQEVQAAAIVVRHGSRLEVPWAAATESAKRAALNMRMYWELLRFALESKAESFDFGRSSADSGTYRFKAQWGAQPLQLHWYYWLPHSAPLPKLNHSNPKYALAAACWRRMPLWCANLLGPRIVRNLP